MKQLSPNEMMDYLDGTLSVERRAQVEAHLAQNADDAQIVADLQMAQTQLRDLEKAEPVRASADFWVKVREGLPSEPKRSPLRGLMSQLSAAIWPSRSPMQLGLRAAAIAAILALLSVFLTPEQAKHNVIANQNTQPAMTASQRDEVQNRVPAPREGVKAPNGDVSNAQTGDSENTDERVP